MKRINLRELAATFSALLVIALMAGLLLYRDRFEPRAPEPRLAREKPPLAAEEPEGIPKVPPAVEKPEGVAKAPLPIEEPESAAKAPVEAGKPSRVPEDVGPAKEIDAGREAIKPGPVQVPVPPQGQSPPAKAPSETSFPAPRQPLEKAPDSYRQRMLTARSHAFAGEEQYAVHAYTEILNRYPEDPDALLGRGSVHTWIGQFEEAERDLLSVTHSYPDYVEVWAALGNLYMQWNKPDAAVKAYSEWLRLEPEPYEPYLARARAYVAKGQLQFARLDFLAAREKGWDKAEADREMTRLYDLPQAELALKEGNYDQAIAGFREHLEKYPDSYAARIGLAHALSRSGQRQAGIQLYNQILEDFPGDHDARLARGRLLTWMGRYELAEQDLFEVTSAYPQSAEGWQALGDLYLYGKRPESAIGPYTRWMELQPEDPRPLLARARALREARQFAPARKDVLAAKTNSMPKTEFRREFQTIDHVPGALPWEAKLSYSYRTFTTDLDDWHTFETSASRKFKHGSIALEGIHTERFSREDDAIAVDAYHDLWDRAYGNLRLQLTPDAEVLPERSYLGEIFQGFGEGWEVSAGYERLEFDPSEADMLLFSLGKYLGNYFLRTRTILSFNGDEPGFAQGFLVRRYFGTSDDFLELEGYVGKRVTTVGPGPEAETLFSRSVRMRAQKFFMPRFGSYAEAGYGDDGQNLVGYELSVGFLARW